MPRMPWTSDVQDAAATPIVPVLRSSTMIDQVADAFAGKVGSINEAAMAAWRRMADMELAG